MLLEYNKLRRYHIIISSIYDIVDTILSQHEYKVEILGDIWGESGGNGLLSTVHIIMLGLVLTLVASLRCYSIPGFSI